MNQILYVENKKSEETILDTSFFDYKANKQKKMKFKLTNWFKFQLFFSIIIIIISISSICIYIYNIQKKENLSNSLISNYNIYKLYSPINSENNINPDLFNNIFGIIQIPKINLYYPIFSQINEELLKVSPCKFSGKTLDETGNICIAGHNYDNLLFFSKLNNLVKDDEIFIFDNLGKKYIYYVYDNYEVNADDLSPILNYNNDEKILTLITCNNINSNRIIIQAKQK